MSGPKMKITISIAPDVLERVRAAVADGRARSVSGYIGHAIAGQLAAETAFDSMIDEMLDASGGPPTDEERAVTAALLGR